MSASDAGALDRALFNGVLLAAADVRISPLGTGFMYGEGLFETIRVKDAQPCLFTAHWVRLTESMHAFSAGPIPGERELERRCAQVIAANAMAAGSLKIVVFRDRTGWSELILARAAGYTGAQYAAGFRLRSVAAGARGGAIHGRKSLNYLSNIQAKRAAAAAGCDEPVFVDPQGQVLEGATTNIFLVKDGRAATPPRSAHILPGIMRGEVIRRLGPERCQERPIALEEFSEADEVFVTNALLGVMPVAQLDATRYDLSQNPVTQSLRLGW